MIDIETDLLYFQGDGQKSVKERRDDMTANEAVLVRPGFGLGEASEKEEKVARPVSTMTPYRYSWADNKYERDDSPAHKAAKSSLGFGVASFMFSWITLLGFIFGIVGLSKASKAKRLGDKTDTRSAGVMYSVLGILGSLILTAVLALCIVGGAVAISNISFDGAKEAITQSIDK